MEYFCIILLLIFIFPAVLLMPLLAVGLVCLVALVLIGPEYPEE